MQLGCGAGSVRLAKPWLSNLDRLARLPGVSNILRMIAQRSPTKTKSHSEKHSIRCRPAGVLGARFQPSVG